MKDSDNQIDGSRRPAHVRPSNLAKICEAIVIDAPTAFLCILGEHLHLNRCFGRGCWQPYRVTTHEVAGRVYDRYDLWFDSDMELTVWFDITPSLSRNVGEEVGL